ISEFLCLWASLPESCGHNYKQENILWKGTLRQKTIVDRAKRLFYTEKLISMDESRNQQSSGGMYKHKLVATIELISTGNAKFKRIRKTSSITYAPTIVLLHPQPK
uniref:Uncharacterized protein n=1 Tax=Parascaris univalens TaxID=6257 RepID=A0A915BFS6_PARUN